MPLWKVHGHFKLARKLLSHLSERPVLRNGCCKNGAKEVLSGTCYAWHCLCFCQRITSFRSWPPGRGENPSRRCRSFISYRQTHGLGPSSFSHRTPVTERGRPERPSWPAL